MSGPEPVVPWKHYRFGLLVTGTGESRFLDRLMRSLCDRLAQTGRGSCEFSLLAKIGQLDPRTSPRHKLHFPGQQKKLPSRDEDFALQALGFFRRGGDFVLLIDDLEGARQAQALEVYTRYRTAFDHVLPADLRGRASIHFLVNMLEAYFIAHSQAINEVMGTDWSDYQGDVETIRHPKGDLKNLLASFNEIMHGEQIVHRLDVPHILSNPDTCASLRTLFGWCWRALGLPPGDEYQLAKGKYFDLTRAQIEQLPAVNV
jgi:hypothetical protein